MTGSHPLDRVLVPFKGFVFRRLFRGNESRYLRFRRAVSQTAARARFYEHETLRAIAPSVRAGDVAIDVGASFGVYTAELARLVGRGGTGARFRTAGRRLRDAGGAVPRQAVGVGGECRACGRARVSPLRRPHAYVGCSETALGALSRGEDGHPLSGNTNVSTLDIYCANFERLAFIKIDAEGWDLDVLRGGRATLKRLRPLVQLEVNDAEMLADLRAFADEVGYRVDDRVLSGVNRLIRPT